MIALISLAQGIIERGLLFGFAVVGTHITSVLIRFDNLALEGAFGLGGAITACLMKNNVHPWLALIGAACIGALSGLVTGVLNTKLSLNNVISGIVVTTGSFSIILYSAGSTVVLPPHRTIFTSLPCSMPCQALFILLTACLLVLISLHWFLCTEVGLLLRTVGIAPQMITNVGKSIDGYKIAGLCLSNTLAAISGALFVNYTGYFSIWAQVGVLLIGLTGMMIAQTFSTCGNASLILGSIAYQAIIACTFELQLDPVWNKFITALLIVLVIIIKQCIKK